MIKYTPTATLHPLVRHDDAEAEWDYEQKKRAISIKSIVRAGKAVTKTALLGH